MKKLLLFFTTFTIACSTLAMEPSPGNDISSLKFQCAGYLAKHPELFIGKNIPQPLYVYILSHQKMIQNDPLRIPKFRNLFKLPPMGIYPAAPYSGPQLNYAPYVFDFWPSQENQFNTYGAVSDDNQKSGNIN